MADNDEVLEAQPPPDTGELYDPTTAEALRFMGVHVPSEAVQPIVARDPFGEPIPDVDPIPRDGAPPVVPTPEVKPKEEPKPAADPVPDQKPKPADPVPDPKPADPVPDPKPADPAPEPPPKPSVMDKLGAAVDKLAEKLDAKPAPAPAPEPPAVDPRVALRLEALAALEQSPAHRGQPLVQQYKAFLGKFGAYQTEWERANPGKAFDPNDDEHETFVATHSPKVSDDEIIRAEARVETLREVDQRMAQERLARQQQESAVRAREDAARAPELLLGELQTKSVEELKAKDPALAFAANEMLTQVPAIVRETHRVFSGGYNEADPLHAQVVKTFEKYDAALAAAPAAQSQSPDGRAYVPLSKWAALTPAQRAQSWTLAAEPSELSRMVVREVATAAKQRAEQVRAWFPAPAAPAAPPPAPTPVPAPTPTPAPPSGGDGPPPTPGAPAPKPQSSQFFQYF